MRKKTKKNQELRLYKIIMNSKGIPYDCLPSLHLSGFFALFCIASASSFVCLLVWCFAVDCFFSPRASHCDNAALTRFHTLVSLEGRSLACSIARFTSSNENWLCFLLCTFRFPFTSRYLQTNVVECAYVALLILKDDPTVGCCKFIKIYHATCRQAIIRRLYCQSMFFFTFYLSHVHFS